MDSSGVWNWIRLRDAIYTRRSLGMPKPWTDDPILRSYRFCNVFRELDTVTIWIREQWREPYAADPDVWFAMAVARLVNWPDTLAEIGYPVPWDAARFVDAMNGRKALHQKVFTGAYMIHADAHFKGNKAEYIAHAVLTPMWTNREKLRPAVGDTLAAFADRLMTCRDFGGFMAGQVTADTKFTEPLRSAPDWWTWAASGPGSKRGLNRTLGRDKNANWVEEDWLEELHTLQKQIDHLAFVAGLPRISAQDLQNCLCEFDKYERVRLGEGFPRSKYSGDLDSKDS